MPKGLYIPIAVGLIEAKHFEKMDRALWTYAELLKRETSEVEVNGLTYGLVSGGEVIKAGDIAQYFKVRLQMARQHLRTLEAEGYILTIRKPAGRIIWVRKSKRGLLGRPLRPKQRAMLIKELERRSPGLFDDVERKEEGKGHRAKRMPSGTKKKGQTEKKGPSPVNEFKRFAGQTYKEKYGEDLLIAHGKDGDLIKRLLATYKKVEKLKRWWQRFLGMKFFTKKETELPHTIGVFYSVIQKVIEVAKKATKEKEAPPPFPPGTKIKALTADYAGIAKGAVGKASGRFFHFEDEKGRIVALPMKDLSGPLAKDWKIELPKETKAGGMGR